MKMKHAGVILMLVIAFRASAATLYVDLNSAASAAPYTNWLSAATNINDAIDAASAGDVILVTNGVYGTGERSADWVATRVAITKPVSVQSVNAGGATITGSNAVRCVYLASGASLRGFALIDGSTREKGGGIHCESVSALVSNCSIAWCTSDAGGGGVWSGTLYDCSLAHNWSYTDHVGSGARDSVLINCSVRSHQYGGVYSCSLTNCVVADNSNHGAELSTLVSCAITNNRSFQGGGVTDCTLYNCLLAGNSASGQTAGGAIFSTLNNCVVRGNSAPQYGGGVAYSTLNDSQLDGNSAGTYGGGAYNCTLSNCVLSGNIASWGGAGAEGPRSPRAG